MLSVDVQHVLCLLLLLFNKELQSSEHRFKRVQKYYVFSGLEGGVFNVWFEMI